MADTLMPAPRLDGDEDRRAPVADAAPSPRGGRAGQRQLKIGITTSAAMLAADGMWTSGIGQNILYLAYLLRRLPFVSPALIGFIDQPEKAIQGLPVIEPGDAAETFDIIIELGMRFDPATMNRFRERGGKLVSYIAGNAMIMNLEAVANGRDIGETPSEVGFDAVWITPQHMETNASYAAMTRTAAVHEAPHIWHPSCLIRSIDTFGANAFFWQNRQPDDRWRIGVFDPTINVVKTFHLPLLVCEEAERRDPDLIDRVLLFSAKRFIGNPHFEELINTLDLGKKGKIFAEGRHPLPSVLGAHLDAVVTHQWQNNLNYLYWDVLYSGRPLIHNAPALADAGYYYRDFDPADGGRVMVDALRSHGSRRAEARPRELEVLWTYSIDNPAVQSAYADLIFDVMETD